MTTVLKMNVQELYVTLQANKRKTDKEFLFIPAQNYETYSNKEGWKKRERNYKNK